MIWSGVTFIITAILISPRAKQALAGTVCVAGHYDEAIIVYAKKTAVI